MAKVSVKQRQVYLVPFAYSNQSAMKVRPALVLSNDKYNQRTDDVIICALTTNIRRLPEEVLVSLKKGTLPAPTVARADTVHKIHQSLFIKNIGEVSEDVHSKVVNMLARLVR